MATINVFDTVQVYESGLGATQVLPVLQDTFYGTSFITGPNGTTTDSHLGGFGDHYYAYVQFDGATIPFNVGTAKATFTETGSNTISPLPTATRLTQAWNELTLSLSNGGSSGNTTPAHTGTAYTFSPPWDDTIGAKQTVNLSDMVQLWATGTVNWGITLQDTVNSPNSDNTFGSSQNADPTVRPILTVTPGVTMAISGGQITLTPQVFDVANVDETIIAVGGNLQNKFETTTVSEFVSLVVTPIFVSVFDATVTSESRQFIVLDRPNVFDATTISESVTLKVVTGSSSTDTTSISEFVSLSVSVSVNVFDATTTSESVALNPQIKLSVFDATTTSEFITLLPSIVISVFDATTVSEAVPMSGTEYIQILSTSFSPASIATMSWWIDATKLVGYNDGDPVPSWDDSSGLGHPATNAGSSFNAPHYKVGIVNGKPVIRFVASNNEGLRAYPFTGAVGSTDPMTVFVVGKLTGGSNQRLFGGVYPAFRNYLIGWWNGQEDSFYAEGFVNSNGAATTNLKLYSVVQTGTLTSFYNQGSLIASNNGGVYNINNAVALSGYDQTGSPNEMSDGDLAEALIFTSALSDADRQAVEAYLTFKWFGTGSPSVSGDGVTVSESVTIAVQAPSQDTENVSDSTSISESVSIQVNVSINVFDTVTGSENVVAANPIVLLSVFDSTTVSESVASFLIWSVRNPHDSWGLKIINW